MKNIWKVVDERKKVRENFKTHLMMKYVEEKSVEFKDQIEKDAINKKFSVEITP